MPAVSTWLGVALAFALLVPGTADTQASFIFNVTDNAVVEDSTLQVVVSVCNASSPLQSFGGTLVNSGGTTGISLSDGPVPACDGGSGYAWMSDVVLKLGVNEIIIDIVDWYWQPWADTLQVTYVSGGSGSPGQAIVISGASGGVRLQAGTGQRLWFEIVNTGLAADTFRVNLSWTGAISSAFIVGTPKFQPTDTKLYDPIDPLGRVTVEVGVSGGMTAGTGTLRLAVSGALPDTAAVPVIVTRPPPPTPTVARARDTVKVAASTSRSVAFTVHNPDPVAARSIALTPSCGAFTSCTAVPSSVTVPAGADSVVHVSFGVPASPAAYTWVRLTASVTSPTGSARDSLVAHATTVPSPTVTVDVATTTPGSAIPREQCLSIAAGSAAGIECGALRVVHSAPSVRTMGVDRAPRLAYLSQHAQPTALVRARISVRDLVTTDSLRTTIALKGGADTVTRIVTRWWKWSPECATLAGCRVVVPVDAVAENMATGHYHYTLEVRVGAGGSPPTGATTGTLILVNDRQGVFGPGWWLEGLERLQPVGNGSDSLLWIGGDGSARLYLRRATAGDVLTFTTRDSISRPDTLRKVGTRYVRHLRNGARVWFGASFRHDSTVNRQGHMTKFTYASSGPARLASITPPKPSGGAPSRNFTFTWDTTKTPILLTSFRVRAQDTAGTRNVTITRDTARRITRLKDPTGDSTRYAYPSWADHRIARRINRLRDTTVYAYDAFGAVQSVTVRMGADSAIVTTLCAAETRSLVACAGDGTAARPLGPSRLTTFLDGPRSDVPDHTRFYVNRFGAPDTLVDATGGRVRLKREHATFPALVTEVTDLAGLVTRTWYSSRGLPDSTTTVAPYGGADATTRFAWHGTFDMATRVQAPTGEVDSIGIDGAGNRIWQKRGPHDSTKVYFAYDARNRLRSVRQGSDSMYYEYDAPNANLGNVWRAHTAMGFRTEFAQDSVGAVTTVWTPTDSAQTDSLRTVQSLVRDVMGRVVTDTTLAPNGWWSIQGGLLTGGLNATKAVVTTTYDSEGRTIGVQRRSLGWHVQLVDPDTIYGPIYSIDEFSTVPFAATTATTTWTYDRAGRIKTETSHGAATTMHYDLAGNVTRIITRRGLEIRQTFDVLNRLTARMTPTVEYPLGACDNCHGDDVNYGTNLRVPYYATPVEGAITDEDVVIPMEMALFGYDAAGRMVQADNPYVRIRRGYYPNGALKADTSLMRKYDPAAATPFGATHVSMLGYEYDLSGRPTVRNDALGGQQRYHYDALGQMDWTSDRATSGSDTLAITFGYDAYGRLRQQAAGGVTGTWTYDRDGRPITRTEGAFADTMRYDARGKRVQVIGRPLYDGGATETFTAAYDGHGHVVASAFAGGAWDTTEELKVDGFGHAYTRYRNRGQVEDTEAYELGAFSAERLVTSTGVPRPFGATDMAGTGPAVKAYDDIALSYDPAGNVTLQASIRRAWSHSIGTGDFFERAATGHQWTWSFYDADERPRVVQQHRVLAEPATPLTLQHEYWHDALGRRVLSRTRADSVACGAYQVTGPEACQQAITRTSWDGAQVVREDRQAGGWQAAAVELDYSGGGGAWYGALRTTQAGAIDVPLVVWKGDAVALRLLRNWRGRVAGGIQLTGGSLGYTPAWPAAITDIRHAPDALLGTVAATSWWGSLALDQRDATGLLYRRNRYYDPQTGRFTQEDPIGLAGGLNLYGYAGGDPINNSDPFGLCPTCDVALSVFLNRPIEITLANGQSWDNVAPSVRQGLHLAAAVTGINQVGVSWTTGGRHGDSSRHYPAVDGIGKAADVYSLDGLTIGTEAGAQRVSAFQTALNHAPAARENFGPSRIDKSGKPYCTSGGAGCQKLARDHKDHIHYSVDK